MLVSSLLLATTKCNFKVVEEQAKYFVHSSGNDQGAGTMTDPFKTIHRLGSIEFAPGDSIFLQGGTNFSGPLQLELNGSIGAPIVLTSFGNGRAMIDGGDQEAFIIQGQWFHIKEINFTGAGRKSGNTTSGLVIDQATHVLVDGVRCSGFQKNGLSVQNSMDVTINNVVAIHNGSIGISIRKSVQCVIQDCTAENNPGDPTNLTNHSGNGILVGESKNILIDRCTATNNGWDMPRVGNGPVGIWAYQTDSIVIQYCIAYRNRTSEGAKDGGGFDFDGGVTNSIIQYCLSYENEGAGYGLFQYPGADDWSNNIIRYNLSINDAHKTEGAGGIFVWNGGERAAEISNCYIHNNLIYNEQKPAVVFEPASEHVNFVFSNNIFIGAGNIVEGPTSGDRFVGNVWHNTPGSKITFRGYKNMNDWAEETGQERLNDQMVGMQIDPQLNGPLLKKISDPYQLHELIGYQLRAGSPVINNGVGLSEYYPDSLPIEDFYGNPAPRGQSFEPGIFEFQD